MDQDAIFAVFFEDAQENLALAESAATALETRPDDAELVRELFRVVHMIKGDAMSLELGALASIAHALEDLLDDLRNGLLAPSPKVVTLILECLDVIRAAVRAASQGTAPAMDPDAMIRRLASVRVPRDASSNSEDVATNEPAGAERAVAVAIEPTVRVASSRLDSAMDLSGELHVALATLSVSLHESRATQALSAALGEVERLHAELQDALIAMRMVPVGPLFRSLYRVVRDAASREGKVASLVLYGEDVAADASVVERLREPLMHSLRNAVAHGLEPPEARESAGKEPVGRIIVRAFRELGALVIEVEDDGRGLDRASIEARARALGMEGVDDRSDGEVFALIFEPGFSTTENVTQTSGRGVGMESIRRALAAIHGTVSVETRPSQGTKVTLRAPISIALLDGFHVEVGADHFIVPRDAIVECVDLSSADCRGSGIVSWAGQPIPVVRLAALFSCEDAIADRSAGIIVESNGARLAVAVDRMHGQLRTVVKPLASPLRGSQCFSGCSLLGSGNFALVIDPPGMFAEARRRFGALAPAHPQRSA